MGKLSEKKNMKNIFFCILKINEERIRIRNWIRKRIRIKMSRIPNTGLNKGTIKWHWRGGVCEWYQSIGLGLNSSTFPPIKKKYISRYIPAIWTGGRDYAPGICYIGDKPHSPNLSDLAECVILCTSWLQSPGKVYCRAVNIWVTPVELRGPILSAQA